MAYVRRPMVGGANRFLVASWSVVWLPVQAIQSLRRPLASDRPPHKILVPAVHANWERQGDVTDCQHLQAASTTPLAPLIGHRWWIDIQLECYF